MGFQFPSLKLADGWGGSFVFTALPLDGAAPPLQSLYGFACRADEGWRILYLGLSPELGTGGPRRWRRDEAGALGATHMIVCPQPGARSDALAEMEAKLIRDYDPPMNRQPAGPRAAETAP